MDEKKEGTGAEGAMEQRELFIGLVQSFQAAAMQQMGKVMNPFTEKIERDMAHAKMSIEMLEMLRARTSGNLTGQEARFLNHILTELRLNYVAEVDKDKAEGAKEEPRDSERQKEP
ncbi:MAG TPA: DUF1844 domain-containing protein [Candidatus Saccharimonadales bacterium]|nr:DUF1844 domain-containing protein [Candidatus Saccharimonadales bacterium]